MSNIQNAEKAKNLARGAVGAASTTDVWVPAAGKLIRLMWFSVTALAASIITVKLGSQVVWESDLAAGSREVMLPVGGVTGVADARLTVTSSAATTVGASAIGREE